MNIALDFMGMDSNRTSTNNGYLKVTCSHRYAPIFYASVKTLVKTQENRRSCVLCNETNYLCPHNSEHLKIDEIPNYDLQELDNSMILLDCHTGNIESLKLRYQADPNIFNRMKNKKDNNKNYPFIFTASQDNHIDVIRFLLSKGVDINIVDPKTKLSALDIAIKNKNSLVVLCLLSENAFFDPSSKQAESLLRLACKEGDLHLVKYLNHCLVNIESKNKRGKTALFISIQNNRFEVVKQLITLKVDVNSSTNERLSPLHIAVKTRNYKIIQLLLENAANINAITKKGMTPLHTSCKIQDLLTVSILLWNGADTGVYNSLKESPLLIAINNKNHKIMMKLIKSRARINTEHKDGEPLLNLAVKTNNVIAVSILLNHNMDPTYVNKVHSSDKMSPFNLAVIQENLPMMKLLISFKCDINNHYSMLDGEFLLCSPIKDIVDQGNLEAAKLLLEINEEILGDFSFHKAAKGPNIEILKLLHKHITNINALNDYGLTPLSIVTYRGDIEAVKFMIDHGSDINARNSDNNIPLHIACLEGYVGIVKLLGSLNSAINVFNDDGLTPISCAICSGSIEVIKELVDHYDNALEIHNSSGYNALCEAIIVDGKHDIIQYLIDNGANVNTFYENCGSPFLLSCQSKNLKTIKLLIDNGVDFNTKHCRGHILYFCLQYCSFDVVKLLLSSGLSLKDVHDYNKKFNVLHYSVKIEKQSAELLRYFIRLGADINYVTSDTNDTALHLAVEDKKFDAVKCLIEAGAKLDIINNKGQLPLAIALENNDKDIIKILKGASLCKKSSKY
ncbi:MAG: ankyrin repeat domain-containing protein [Endozoicomonadaceae bacterium]|nr:ankyrin repeat domain-containing protein [Endozoicomonadaceae bacterium]